MPVTISRHTQFSFARVPHSFFVLVTVVTVFLPPRTPECVARPRWGSLS
jgi:hypothetical protein